MNQHSGYNFRVSLVTLHGNGAGTRTGDRTATLRNNRLLSLSLSQTSVNISITYCTFHLVPVPVTVPFPCSVTKPLVLEKKQQTN